MAKGKRAAALFEVIHSGKPSKFQAPIRRRRHSVIGQMLRSTALPFTAAGHVLRDSANAATALVVRNRPAKPPKKPIPGVDLTMDAERKLIAFRVSYHSAIVAGFALLVAIGLAYVIGVRMNHPLTAATSSPSTAELRAHGAHPEVLNVSNGELLTQTDPPTALPPSMSAITHPPEDAPVEEKATKASATSPPAVERVIGRQYIIVQTFADEAGAKSAQAFLEKNKFPCTIENGLAGWAPKSKFCLVTTTGFDHAKNNIEFEDFESKLSDLGDVFSAQHKGRSFDPHAYRWKGPA